MVFWLFWKELWPDFNIDIGKRLVTGLLLVHSLLSKEGSKRTFKFDLRGSILATLSLAASMIVAAIDKEKD